MIGRRFGNRVVIKKAAGAGRSRWVCKCDCGTINEVEAHSLKNGLANSCGCNSSRSTIGKRTTTHGMCKDRKPTSEYVTWQRIKSRCTREKDPKWKDYGARGITVCDRWLHSFESFLDDMGWKPFPSAQIDRINNENGYCKENCRWVTNKQNSRNRRDNLLFTYQKLTLSLSEWSERFDMDYRTVWQRIKICGWPFIKAIETPTKYGFNGRR